MENNHTLGTVNVSSGELLTFTVNTESSEDRPRTVTVITLADIDVSKEMADYYRRINRTTEQLQTDNAIIGFITSLAEAGLVKVTREHRVPFGTLGRPASRLTDEYKYSVNPEQFWEAKLLNRYSKACFNVITHQSHMLTVMHNVDAPFSMTATIIDSIGGVLGMLRLDIISDNRHTLIGEEDIERLRLGLQADITMHVPDLMLMVESVSVQNNPIFGINAFKQHRDFTPLRQAEPSL